MIAELIRLGADPEKENKDGLSPLVNAIFHNEPESVRELIRRGADPNRRAEDDTTPLQMAIHKNNPKVVAALLDGGADCNARLEGQITMLEFAASINARDAAKELILRDAKTSKELDAAAKGASGKQRAA